jgi:RNA polymerase sigma-70 factor (ECF subfamily)
MALHRHEQQEGIRQALRRLPSNLRIALTLQQVEGISNQQIADITGCSVSAVEARLHRAKSKLRKLLVQLAP